MIRSCAFPLILGFLVGCGGSDGPSSGPTSSGAGGGGGASSGSGGAGGSGGGSVALCAKQHDETAGGDALIVCDDAFDTAPYVHLPDASATSDVMALDRCTSFIDRDGKQHPPSAAITKSLCMKFGTDQDQRVHGWDLYKVTLDAKGEVTAFARYAVIDEKNLLRPLTGSAAEGKISKKKSDGHFNLDTSIPIRVSFGQPEVVQSEKDGTTSYQLVGTVENLSSGVTSADGPCLPPMSSDSGNPFPGVTKAELWFFRVPSMHLPGDDEGVMDIRADGTSMGTTMAPAWFLGPATLFKTLTAPPAYQGIGHGTPGDIPSVDLSVKKGGGATCSP